MVVYCRDVLRVFAWDDRMEALLYVKTGRDTGINSCLGMNRTPKEEEQVTEREDFE